MSTTSSPRHHPNPLWNDAQRQALRGSGLRPWCQRMICCRTACAWPVPTPAFAATCAWTALAAHASLVVMDAPPDKEDCQPFVHVAQLMAQAGLRVPEVLAWDRTQGFMLLTDWVRTRCFRPWTCVKAPPPLAPYLDAVEALVTWQSGVQPGQLPPYDEALLMRELALFPQWYVGTYVASR